MRYERLVFSHDSRQFSDNFGRLQPVAREIGCTSALDPKLPVANVCFAALKFRPGIARKLGGRRCMPCRRFPIEDQSIILAFKRSPWNNHYVFVRSRNGDGVSEKLYFSPASNYVSQIELRFEYAIRQDQSLKSYLPTYT
jgi:hypothetical protein